MDRLQRHLSRRDGRRVGYGFMHPLLFHLHMRVILLSSGGKDSAYAVWWAVMRGWDVEGIATIRTAPEGSMMFQGVGTAVAGLQAASASIAWLPIRQREEDGVESLERALRPIVEGTRWPKTPTWSESEREEAEWPAGWSWPEGLARLRPGQPIDAIISGALRSDYQRTRLERMADRLGVRSFSPLWHHDSEQHMRALVDHGFQVVITSVSADGLGERWVGRRIDHSSIGELVDLRSINGINVDGEGGEFETTVVGAPWMGSTIEFEGDVVWEGSRGHSTIENARLTNGSRLSRLSAG